MTSSEVFSQQALHDTSPCGRAVDVSVIFATRNRAEILQQTLEGLAAQVLDGISLEVVVVDNGSTDHTPRILRESAAKIPLKILSEERPGKNRALNTALSYACGDLLVFTDDDVIPDPNWLRELQAAALRWPDDAVFGGVVIPRFPEQTPAWVQNPEIVPQAQMFSQYWFEQSEGPIDQPPFGGNLAIRAEIFRHYQYDEHIGPSGTNYAMGSETELLLRLKQDGYRFIYVPSARVDHVVRSEQTTMKWLLGRTYRYARGKVHHRQTEFDQFIREGIPLRWRTKWLRLGLAYLVALLGNEQQRFRAGSRWQKHRGMMDEVRNLRRARGLPSGSKGRDTL